MLTQICNRHLLRTSTHSRAKIQKERGKGAHLQLTAISNTKTTYIHTDIHTKRHVIPCIKRYKHNPLVSRVRPPKRKNASAHRPTDLWRAHVPVRNFAIQSCERTRITAYKPAGRNASASTPERLPLLRWWFASHRKTAFLTHVVVFLLCQVGGMNQKRIRGDRKAPLNNGYSLWKVSRLQKI